MVEFDARKLESFYQPSRTVDYYLPLDGKYIHLNPFIGQKIILNFSGTIRCVHCQRVTKKSFSQGYCFPCARSLAQTDLCIVRPHTCAFFEGGCRDSEWGEKNCMTDHVVYLANSSGLKVGITRQENRFNRWIDQGASKAIPIARVSKRIDAGKIEAHLSKNLSDKTNWRKMLTNQVPEIDLQSQKELVLKSMPEGISWEPLTEPVYSFRYPVHTYPEKVKSHNLDKTPTVEGRLLGIKGQYFILDTGVLNIRKFTGYELKLDVEDHSPEPIASKPSSISSSGISSISSAD